MSFCHFAGCPSDHPHKIKTEHGPNHAVFISLSKASNGSCITERRHMTLLLQRWIPALAPQCHVVIPKIQHMHALSHLAMKVRITVLMLTKSLLLTFVCKPHQCTRHLH